MVIANLVVRLMADQADLIRNVEKSQTTLAKLDSSVAKSNASLSSMVGTVNKLAGAFGVTLGAGAIIGFGKELMRMGDEIVKVADRTGLTTEEVQKLSFVAEQSGNDIGALTSAIGQLQNRLATGDKSAVGAVKALGINLVELRAAAPYEQMAMIADAIAKIPDPAARAALATQLFGKAGREVVPTLIADFRKLGDAAPVMSDKTVRALDTAGDALSKGWMQIKVWAAESYNWAGNLFDRILAMGYRVTAAVYDTTASAAELLKKLPGGGKVLGAVGISSEALRWQAQEARDQANSIAYNADKVTEAIRKQAPVVVDLTDKTKTHEAATRKAAQAEKEWADATRNARTFGVMLLGNFQDISNVTAETTNLLAGLTAEGLIPAEHGFAKLALEAPQVTAQFDIVGKSAKSLKQNLMEVAQAIPQVMVSALTGGGGAKGAAMGVGSMVGGAVGQWLGKGISALGSLGGPIGAAVGSLAGPVIGWIASKFGPSKEYLSYREGIGTSTQQYQSLRDSILGQYGSTDAIRAMAGKYGLSPDLANQIARSQSMSQFDVSNVNDLNRALAEFKTAVEKATTAEEQAAAEAAKHSPEAMQAIASKYGFSDEVMKGMGSTYWTGILGSQSKQLYNDYQQLLKGGAEENLMTAGMGGAVSGIVSEALTAGVAIPGYLREMITRLASWGSLIDENGKALDATAIKYDETAVWLDANTAATQELTTSINNLTDAINGSNATAGIWHPGKLDISPEANFKDGTEGYQWFGSGTPAMLHGWEAVVPAGRGRGLSGQGAQQTIILNLDGKTIARATARNLPSVLELYGAKR